jgi:hypothetical protein
MGIATAITLLAAVQIRINLAEVAGAEVAAKERGPKAPISVARLNGSAASFIGLTRTIVSPLAGRGVLVTSLIH